MPTFHREPDTDPIRLDVFLVDHLSISRSQIQKHIKQGLVKVNGEVIKRTHTAIEPGAEVIYSPPDTSNDPPPPPPKLNILYEDKEIVVINKPAGTITHPANEQDTQASISQGFVAKYPEAKSVGHPLRPGIVHRLDKDVSGAMILARTEKAFEFLKEQFATRTTEKEYLALVYGQFAKPYGSVDFRIKRSKASGKMVAKPASSTEGKDALTEHWTLEEFKTATYLRIRIHTGRTHQIRVHMRAVDHPVVGDPLYNKRHMKNIRPIELGRIFLHAHKLTIPFPDGSTRSFEAPLPKDLQQILDTLPKN